MIVLQHDDSRAASDGKKLRRRRNAVTDRGYQRNVGRLGIDQPRGGHARTFVLLVRERGLERPRHALASYRGAAGFEGFARQRAVGGRIEVADLARYLEQGALRGKHGKFSSSGRGYCCRSISSRANYLKATASSPRNGSAVVTGDAHTCAPQRMS